MFITRFAPAPTGLLHIGHIVNAIFVWGAARAWNGQVLLRIEDHDRQRSRTEYEDAILDDLDWLGFIPNEPPTESFRNGSCLGRQSDREHLYEEMLARLRDRRLIYACDCTRLSIPPLAEGSEARYPGTCSDKKLPERFGCGIRICLDDHLVQFDDLRHGTQAQRPVEQCGDLLARDRRGNWTYQFAVTVDDMLQGVTFVIRGDDLLPSTGRQIQLAHMLGRETPPVFLHHPLIMKTPTQKLSKSDGDTSIRSLRQRGWTPQRVIGHAASLAGLVGEVRDLAAVDAADLVRHASRAWIRIPAFPS